MSSEPMLPGEWPEPVKTADMIIDRFITEALEQQERFSDSMRRNRHIEPGNESPAGRAARFENALRVLAYIHSAAVADLLLVIQGMAPGLADQIIREWDERGECGDAWPELLWEWADERRLDPDNIIENIKRELAKKENS